ncbi:hypothetical protein LK10_11770 [Sinomonas humi]|uniref:AbiEi antitoxin N-terminal domain-containing protein n=1 Tax=Sinomonas humi TaxID=1338436 RepID=A0A0B2ALL9_9MICC|nr:hypothetical protein LK10_11770 [Sinomonas humi]
MFTLRDAVASGVSKSSLYRMVASGTVEMIGSGLFAAEGALEGDPDLLEAAHKAPQATICLASALARHQLIDEIPSAVDLALPRGKTPPELTAPVRWHVFDRGTFALGRSMVKIEGSHGAEIGLYSAERSIVDAFRLRGTVGYETGVEALRNWLRRRGAQPSQLMEIASALPRAKGPLRQALEVLS